MNIKKILFLLMFFPLSFQIVSAAEEDEKLILGLAGKRPQQMKLEEYLQTRDVPLLASRLSEFNNKGKRSFSPAQETYTPLTVAGGILRTLRDDLTRYHFAQKRECALAIKDYVRSFMRELTQAGHTSLSEDFIMRVSDVERGAQLLLDQGERESQPQS